MQRRQVLAGIGAVGMFGQVVHADDGFVVPAEEDRHEMTLMQWPVNRRVYRDRGFLELVQDTIADIANTISEFEPVVMLADPSYHGALQEWLSQKVMVWGIPTDDLWARDSGPIVAKNADGRRTVRHIQFNGWGGKQDARNDMKVATRVAERLGLPLIETGLHGEAGGIEQDGAGTLMAHESSWKISNRNSGMSRTEIETALLQAYGATRMIWAPGLKGQDITDYHIDALARFTEPGHVLMCLPGEPDMSEPFHRAAIQTHDILKAEGMVVETIPEPWERRVSNDDFLANYANYYVCNGAVIAQNFGDRETDKIARAALSRAYPGREVVQLNCDPLGELGGGIHCATHQIPA